MDMTPETLRQLHGILLEMMVDFDRVCREHDIRYFLGGGTLLGAIRHGGFIPWDDDVDLMMDRENYEKLCALPADAFGERYFFQTFRTDPEYHGDMAKVRLNGTTYATEFSSGFPEMHQGIFIDIFAHDQTAKSKFGRKLHIFTTTLARSMVFHKWQESPMQFYGKHEWACKIVTALIRVVPMRSLENLREFIFRFFEKGQSGLLYDGMGMHLSHGSFPGEWLDEVLYVDFAGVSLPVPKEYDNYLKFSYGDYMQIPKEENRRLHNIYKLDLGEA